MYSIIKELMLPTDGETWMVTHKNDGRLTYIALARHYNGESMTSIRKAHAEKVIENLFYWSEHSLTFEMYCTKMKENFHMIVVKGLYACKCGRPDIHTAIAHLMTRVQCPNKNDLEKLIRLLKYINGTKTKKLQLSANDL